MTYAEKIGFIHRYLSHELNANEIKEFEAWLEYNNNNKLLLDQITGIWKSAAQPKKIEFNAESAFLKHKALLNEEKKEPTVLNAKDNSTRVVFMSRLRFAAASLVLLIAALYVINISSGDKINAEAVQLVMLEDGTKVWLDAGSQFTIKKINNTERKVSLKGKAYFEVAKNSASPFTISSGNFDVKVVGTRFIIDSKKSIVKVRDGKVAVATSKQEVFLTANQSVEIKKDVLSEIDNTIFDNKLLWFNEDLKFDNTPFDLVIKDLTINFGVTIDLPEKNDWSNCGFTSGSLKKNTFEEVLTILKLTYEIEYKKTGDTSYKITRVKCK